jgi:hypothetical protein
VLVAAVWVVPARAAMNVDGADAPRATRRAWRRPARAAEEDAR